MVLHGDGGSLKDMQGVVKQLEVGLKHIGREVLQQGLIPARYLLEASCLRLARDGQFLQ